MSAAFDKLWTPEEDAALERMWLREGLSGAQIASLMPGRSRNSILGRAFRKGWMRPVEVARINNHKARRDRPRGAPSLPRRKFQPTVPGWKNDAPVAPTPPKPGTTVESLNAKPWIQRQANQCAFPVGEAEGADQLSCCNPTGGSTYCAGHTAIMTVPAGKLNTHGIDMAKAKRQAAPRERFFADWAAA